MSIAAKHSHACPDRVQDPEPVNYRVENQRITLFWTVNTTGEFLRVRRSFPGGASVSVSARQIRLVNIEAWHSGIPSLGIGPRTLVPADRFVEQEGSSEALLMRFGPRIGHLGGNPILDYLEINGVRYAPDGKAKEGVDDTQGRVFIQDGVAYKAINATTDQTSAVRQSFIDGIRRRIAAWRG